MKITIVERISDSFGIPNIIDDKQDDRIRAALKDYAQGQLGDVAAITGIAGGERELRKIMNSRDALTIMDRVLLTSHLKLGN